MACCEANKALPAHGIVDLTFGNVSVVDRELGVMAIKPSGVDYTALTPEDMVILRLDAKPEADFSMDLKAATVEGDLRPSSDTPTHLRLFQAFPHIGSVVHTHSRNATAFAQAGRAIPCMGTTHADYFYGEVPVTREMTREEVSRHYEWETGNVIVECLEPLDPDQVNAVLVRGHAPFVWGKTGAKAVEIAFALEVIAEMTLKSLSLAEPGYRLPRHLLDKHYLRKHGRSAYYGQPS